MPVSCKDEPEQIPAYIKIEPFVVNSPGGAGWQKITEGWLYIDNLLVGGYALPATVPVLDSGNVKVTILPGVRENGLTETPTVYPFFQPFEGNYTLQPAETTTIQPATQYYPNAVFPWSLDRSTLNNSTIGFENRDGDSSNTFVLVTDGAFEGRSLKLAVDTAHTLMEVATELLDELPVTQERPVWLELHYQCDMPFELWILGSDGGGIEISQAVYLFAPYETWNKIYFNLSPFLIALKQDKYRLFFRASLPRGSNGQYSQTAGTVYLDNLRLIHF